MPLSFPTTLVTMSFIDDDDTSEWSDGEGPSRSWIPDGQSGNSSNLPEPIGTVARSGQLGAPLGIAHLALGAVSAAMSAYQPVRSGKEESEGLPRVRMLSCLHALFTQLHDPELADQTRGEESGKRGPQRGERNSCLITASNPNPK